MFCTSVCSLSKSFVELLLQTKQTWILFTAFLFILQTKHILTVFFAFIVMLTRLIFLFYQQKCLKRTSLLIHHTITHLDLRMCLVRVHRSDSGNPVLCQYESVPLKGPRCFCTQRRLQHVSVLLAGSYWLDVQGVHQSPEVVGVVAAVEAQAEPDARHAHHRGDADGGGVPRVASLQLHPSFKVIGGRDARLRTEKCVFTFCHLVTVPLSKSFSRMRDVHYVI